MQRYDLVLRGSRTRRSGIQRGRAVRRTSLLAGGGTYAWACTSRGSSFVLASSRSSGGSRGSASTPTSRARRYAEPPSAARTNSGSSLIRADGVKGGQEIQRPILNPWACRER